MLGSSLCFPKLNILKRERNYVYSLPTRKVRITRKLLSQLAHALVQYVYDQICKLKTYTRPSEKSDNFELLDFLLNLAKGRRKFDFYLRHLVWYRCLSQRQTRNNDLPQPVAFILTSDVASSVGKRKDRTAFKSFNHQKKHTLF